MLNQRYYDAVVISDEIDPNHAGAVRVLIVGVTEDLEDKDQPFVLPVVSSFMAVPTKGTYLRVEFEDGDIQRGRYTHASADLSYLPKEYVDGYPNVAVTNLGSDLFHMIHYRDSKETIIKHDSSSRILWDGEGRIFHDSDLAYQNAGYGAKNGTGRKIQSVLTGGSVDPFCCTPVGSSNGSEYLWVSHVSKKTVEGPPPPKADTTDTAILEVGQTRPLLAGTVEFIESPSKTPSGNRDISWVLVTISGGNDFITVYNDIMDETKNISYHYVIGTAEADSLPQPSLVPSISGSTRNADEEANPKGFTQFVELNNMAAFGMNTDSGIGDGSKVGARSITVCLISDGGTIADPTSGFTEYQYGKLNDILEHVRAEYGDHIVVAGADDFDFSPDVSLGNFDKSRF